MPADVQVVFDLTAPIIRGMEREVEAVVHTTAALIADVAVHKILDGPKSGTIYTSGPPPLPHQASAPGESPANWEGQLAGSVHAVPTGPREAEVRVGTEYALALELGRADGSIAPRPFLQPSVDEVRPLFEENVATLMEKAAAG